MQRSAALRRGCSRPREHRFEAVVRGVAGRERSSEQRRECRRKAGPVDEFAEQRTRTALHRVGIFDGRADTTSGPAHGNRIEGAQRSGTRLREDGIVEDTERRQAPSPGPAVRELGFADLIARAAVTGALHHVRHSGQCTHYSIHGACA